MFLSSLYASAEVGKIKKFECYFSENDPFPHLVLDGDESADDGIMYYRVLLTHEYKEPTYYGLQLRISSENEETIHLISDHSRPEDVFFKYDKATEKALVSVGLGETKLAKCAITYL